ncbi:MAG: MATE family efflux transporter [Truepera sp.]|jgi:MATE family multidrug resistance protein|nr:MATE family efflux transporter [Truepera sp.]
MFTAVFAPRKSEFLRLLRLAGPLVLAQLAQNGMSFVDTFMVGRLGPGALAAMALGATTFFTTSIVTSSVLFAVGPVVAQAIGAGRRDEAGHVASQALWLAVVFAVPGIVIFHSIGPLLYLFGLEPETAALAAGYLRAISLGFPFFLGFQALRGFLEGNGDARPIMYIAFFGVALNVLLCEALIFGHFGLPALGVVGTGYATATVYLVMFVLVAALVTWRYPKQAVLRGMRHLEFQVMRELVRVGWPIGFTTGAEVGLFTLSALLMGRFGEDILAGHQVAMQSVSMTFMVPLGMSIATGVLVGQAAGRGDDAAVRRMGFMGILAAIGFMTLTACLFAFAPRYVIGIYASLDDPTNASMIATAAGFLGIAAIFQLFDGVQVTAIGALRGLRDTRMPMLYTIFSYWLVGVPVGLLLAFKLGFGPRGLWFGMVAGLATSAVLMTVRFARRSRQVAPVVLGSPTTRPS